jgi:cephalosporin hydroxylase
MISIFDKKNTVKFDTQSLFAGHNKVTYRGVRTAKCPFDYVMYQMLVWELKPDLIIEIGTNKGGSALYLADLLNLIGKGIVHTIDITDEADAIVRDHPRIKIFTGGYQGYDLSLANGYSNVLVIEDGSHQYADTLAIMKKFAAVVSLNSYLIIEDGIINELKLSAEYNGGPLKAIGEFLPAHPEFEIDRRWCDLFGRNATVNVDGYLKKIKNPS